VGRTALYGRALSPREREVVQWLTMGLSRADIAARMGLGEETIKTHLAVIYQKLDAAGRYEVAARHRPSAPATPATPADGARKPGSPSAPTSPGARNEPAPPTPRE